MGLQDKTPCERDRSSHTLVLSQEGYIKKIVERYGMSYSKGVATPLDTGCKLSKRDGPSTPEAIAEMKNVPYQSAVGAIMYAMLGTRPDIAFAVTTLSQFTSNPGMPHWVALKRVLRYLNASANSKLVYSGCNGYSAAPQLIGYCDADWASNVDDRRSTTGYVFMLAGGAISWKTKKQPTVALSSVEAEYMAATQATKEAIWL
ncbi:MAG: Ty1/Copia family ribonuclease HI, partial [Candidatus Saccharimonadales bacterium]